MITRSLIFLGLLCATFVGQGYGEPGNLDDDGKLNMKQIANKYGYPMETHTICTKDHYVLTMYRMPHGRGCDPEKPRVPVLIQHGMLSSSYDFLILGPNKSLAFLLADECYDVWLGNNRGNSESKKHIWEHPKDKDFWSFSWHEMGEYDILAEVDYILNTTGQPSTHYIGHSQGTTQFFVFGSLYPEHQHKIRSMHALSPVAFMNHLKSPLVRVLNMFYSDIKRLSEMIGLYELFPSESFLNFLGSKICHDKYPNLQSVCCNVLFLLCGFDEPQLNTTLLPSIIGHTPAGASVKQLMHYAQGIKSGHFRQFDYGAVKNLKLYNRLTPPDYPVQNIKIPMAIYYASNDYLAAIRDVEKLVSMLPNVVDKYLVPYKSFSHLDFIYAIEVKRLVYERVIENLKRL